MSNFQEKSTPQAPTEQTFSLHEYAEVWSELLDAVGDSNYFSGTIETNHSQFDSLLTITIIIYRDTNHPECPIRDIVPIWWEMTTYKEEQEVLNDFSFYALREFAKQN